jgi:hypothetical protein
MLDPHLLSLPDAAYLVSEINNHEMKGISPRAHISAAIADEAITRRKK